MFVFLLNKFSGEVNDKKAVGKPKMIPDDADLIARIKRNDLKAFDELVDRHKKRAFYTALGMVGDKELAHDITQDAWVAAYKAMPRFIEGKPFYPWFHRILTNLCKNALRHRSVENRVMPSRIEDENMPQLEGTVLEPESLVMHREIKGAVWSAIQKLSPDHREIVVLVHFESRSYKEVSELLDIPIGTVMSRLYYARSKLAEMLREVLGYDE